MLPGEFPDLKLEYWRPTRDTIHGYAKLLGAVRGAFSQFNAQDPGSACLKRPHAQGPVAAADLKHAPAPEVGRYREGVYPERGLPEVVVEDLLRPPVIGKTPALACGKGLEASFKDACSYGHRPPVGL